MSVAEHLARMRVPLGFAVAAIVLFLARPTLVSIAAGFPVGVLGLLFRAAGAGVLQKNERLARTGPYRLTRNPLYFGSFLLAAAFSIMSRSLVCAVILIVVFAAVYRVVIRREEAHLSDAFGSEYEEFRNAVPTFFPHSLSTGIFEDFSWNAYRSNREYNALLGFLAAMAVLLVRVVV